MFVRLLNAILLITLVSLTGWTAHCLGIDEEVANWVIPTYMSILVMGLVLNGALILARVMSKNSALEEWVWISSYFLIGCLIFGGDTQMLTGARIQREADIASITFSSPELQSTEAREQAIVFLQGILDNDHALVASLFPSSYHGDSEVAALAGTLAIQYRRPEMLRFLLDKGLSAQAAWDGTPLLITAIDTSRIRDVELLIKAGAQLNTADAQGMTPLITAVLVDHAEIVELLLEAGADPHKTSAVGYHASEYSRSKQVSELLPQLAGESHESDTE